MKILLSLWNYPSNEFVPEYKFEGSIETFPDDMMEHLNSFGNLMDTTERIQLTIQLDCGARVLIEGSSKEIDEFFELRED